MKTEERKIQEWALKALLSGKAPFLSLHCLLISFVAIVEEMATKDFSKGDELVKDAPEHLREWVKSRNEGREDYFIKLISLLKEARDITQK